MTKEQIPSMSVLPLPFAMKGETVVPVSELDPFSDSGNEGALGFDSKYQWNDSVPPSRFITRQLMNRLLGQISGRQFLKQCGALDTFDQNVCDAIGGYPQGAVLQYLDGDILYDVVSMRDNNDTDYTKVGVDGTNWRIYGSSVFMYVYPDYGSSGQDNILKRWATPTPAPTNGDNTSEEEESGIEILFGPLSISSPCWIQAFISNPEASSGMDNYQSGIIFYGGDTPDPESIPANDDTRYTQYELTEGGTVAVPIFPVLPGDKIAAFITARTETSYDIIIRKLTPVRTR